MVIFYMVALNDTFPRNWKKLFKFYFPLKFSYVNPEIYIRTN